MLEEGGGVNPPPSIMLTQDELPTGDLNPWVQSIVALALGGGGVHYMRVWLEQRRLNKESYRGMLLDRVRELEERNGRLSRRQADLRVELAHEEERGNRLEERVAQLEARISELLKGGERTT